MKDKIIEYLLQNADPSIVLRVKKEILQSCSETEEENLIRKISEQDCTNHSSVSKRGRMDRKQLPRCKSEKRSRNV